MSRRLTYRVVDYGPAPPPPVALPGPRPSRELLSESDYDDKFLIPCIKVRCQYPICASSSRENNIHESTGWKKNTPRYSKRIVNNKLIYSKSKNKELNENDRLESYTSKSAFEDKSMDEVTSLEHDIDRKWFRLQAERFLNPPRLPTDATPEKVRLNLKQKSQRVRKFAPHASRFISEVNGEVFSRVTAAGGAGAEPGARSPPPPPACQTDPDMSLWMMTSAERKINRDRVWVMRLSSRRKIGEYSKRETTKGFKWGNKDSNQKLGRASRGTENRHFNNKKIRGNEPDTGSGPKWSISKYFRRNKDTPGGDINKGSRIKKSRINHSKGKDIDQNVNKGFGWKKNKSFDKEKYKSPERGNNKILKWLTNRNSDHGKSADRVKDTKKGIKGVGSKGSDAKSKDIFEQEDGKLFKWKPKKISEELKSRRSDKQIDKNPEKRSGKFFKWLSRSSSSSERVSAKKSDKGKNKTPERSKSTNFLDSLKKAWKRSPSNEDLTDLKKKKSQSKSDTSLNRNNNTSLDQIKGKNSNNGKRKISEQKRSNSFSKVKGKKTKHKGSNFCAGTKSKNTKKKNFKPNLSKSDSQTSRQLAGQPIERGPDKDCDCRAPAKSRSLPSVDVTQQPSIAGDRVSIDSSEKRRRKCALKKEYKVAERKVCRDRVAERAGAQYAEGGAQYAGGGAQYAGGGAHRAVCGCPRLPCVCRRPLLPLASLPRGGDARVAPECSGAAAARALWSRLQGRLRGAPSPRDPPAACLGPCARSPPAAPAGRCRCTLQDYQGVDQVVMRLECADAGSAGFLRQRQRREEIRASSTHTDSARCASEPSAAPRPPSLRSVPSSSIQLHEEETHYEKKKAECAGLHILQEMMQPHTSAKSGREGDAAPAVRGLTSSHDVSYGYYSPYGYEYIGSHIPLNNDEQSSPDRSYYTTSSIPVNYAYANRVKMEGLTRPRPEAGGCHISHWNNRYNVMPSLDFNGPYGYDRCDGPCRRGEFKAPNPCFANVYSAETNVQAGFDVYPTIGCTGECADSRVAAAYFMYGGRDGRAGGCRRPAYVCGPDGPCRLPAGRFPDPDIKDSTECGPDCICQLPPTRFREKMGYYRRITHFRKKYRNKNKMTKTLLQKAKWLLDGSAEEHYSSDKQCHKYTQKIYKGKVCLGCNKLPACECYYSPEGKEVICKACGRIFQQKYRKKCKCKHKITRNERPPSAAPPPPPPPSPPLPYYPVQYFSVTTNPAAHSSKQPPPRTTSGLSLWSCEFNYQVPSSTRVLPSVLEFRRKTNRSVERPVAHSSIRQWFYDATRHETLWRPSVTASLASRGGRPGVRPACYGVAAAPRAPSPAPHLIPRNCRRYESKPVYYVLKYHDVDDTTKICHGEQSITSLNQFVETHFTGCPGPYIVGSLEKYFRPHPHASYVTTKHKPTVKSVINAIKIEHNNIEGSLETSSIVITEECPKIYDSESNKSSCDKPLKKEQIINNMAKEETSVELSADRSRSSATFRRRPAWHVLVPRRARRPRGTAAPAAPPPLPPPLPPRYPSASIEPVN